MNGIIEGGALVTYGPTLARPMSADYQRDLLANIDPARGRGAVHVFVTSTYAPDLLNVETLIDDLQPRRAIVALATAARRLAQLYGGAREPSAILSEPDAQDVRTKAEDLVDLCRASRVNIKQGELLTRGFDLTREEAVNAVMVALALASVTPDRLTALAKADQ